MLIIFQFSIWIYIVESKDTVSQVLTSPRLSFTLASLWQDQHSISILSSILR